MIKIRLFFKKKNRAKYISHLDMNRCMMRALKRSGIPIWYTEGFNPHMYLTFPLPIPLGYESEYECVDIKLTDEMHFEKIKSRVNSCLPSDIQIFKIISGGEDQKEIAWADYEIKLYCEEGKEDQLCTDFTGFISADEIKVMKKTKKAPKEIDLKPLVELRGLSNDFGYIILEMRLATGIETNINPSLVLDNFKSSIEITSTAITRLVVYNKKLEIFE